jgi:ferredoxin/flavodoxin---NADP+ reductase
MTYVITGNCCNDAACVFVCPVNCIHPSPGEDGYESAEILLIDPDVCIDCGACADACPVDAVLADYELEPEDEVFAEVARDWYARPEHQGYTQKQQRLPRRTVETSEPLRVAVIGSGPAACYAIDALTSTIGLAVEITVVEKLLAPGGLVRYGVAPDHEETKAIANQFNRALGRPGVTLRLGVEVGRDVSIEQLARDHHAVIIGSGASAPRHLDVPGGDLPGVVTGADFVAWYNGHPDRQQLAVNLSSERVVLVGNGNVSLDVARILLSGADALRHTDIAEHALEQLAESHVREVVVVARRGLEHAAFTVSELEGLSRIPGVGISTPERELTLDTSRLDAKRAGFASFKQKRLAELSAQRGAAASLVFRFGMRPSEIVGQDHVTSIRFDGGLPEEIATGLVVTTIGYRGAETPGVPFDADRGIIPNVRGRVDGLPGMYVVGWVKRGPSGGIGTNRWCAAETVAALVDDFESGNLTLGDRDSELVARLDQAPGLVHWRALEKHERQAGQASGRPRLKVVDPAEQLKVMTTPA